MSRQTVSKSIKEALPKWCYNCGSTENLTYHHIVPVVYGGRNVLSNIAVLCCNCHSAIHYGKSDAMANGEAIKTGIKLAQERGVHVGKPCADYDNVMRLIATHSTQFNDVFNPNYTIYTEAEIMEMAGVKPVCYAKCKRMLKEAMDAPEWRYDWDKPTIQKKMPLYDHFIKKIRTDERKLNMHNLSAADKKRIIGDTVNG